MKPRSLPPLFGIALAVALSFGALARAQDDVRFSKALAPQEFTASGLSSLSSDQLAVLDALVRRDIAGSYRTSTSPRADRFSDRLSADERRNAGLETLADAERLQLDACVQRLIAPPPPSSSLVGPGSAGLANAVQSVKIRREPEIHGSVSLMVAAGSHGYSAYGGGMVLTYDDPANRFSVAVGYSEIHEKGDYLWRDCRGRPFRGLGDPLW